MRKERHWRPRCSDESYGYTAALALRHDTREQDRHVRAAPLFGLCEAAPRGPDMSRQTAHIGKATDSVAIVFEIDHSISKAACSGFQAA